MSSYREQTSKIKVELFSPDRSVKAVHDQEKGLTFHLEDRKLTHHSDDSLAEQVAALIRSAGRGSKTAHRKIHELRHGAPMPTEPVNEAAASRLREKQRQIDQLHVRQVSKNRFVAVELRGGSEVEVRIKPGTVGHPAIPADSLAREINDTLALAIREYAKGAMKLQRG